MKHLAEIIVDKLHNFEFGNEFLILFYALVSFMLKF